MHAYPSVLKEILNNKRSSNLVVERYQRSYSWTETQITTLFRDQFSPIVSRDNSQKIDNPFIGAIVVLPVKGKRSEIVDGQQRLTTLTMIIGLASKLLISNNQTLPSYVENFLINNNHHPEEKLWIKVKQENLDLYSMVMSTTVTISQIQNLVLKNLLQERMPEAVKVILNEIEDFVVEFRGYNKSATRSEAYIALLSHIIKNLEIVVVEVASHSQALAVFEALNAAGEPLTLDQLVKSLLLRVFEKDKVDNLIDDAWGPDPKSTRDARSFYSKLRKTSSREEFLLYYCEAFINCPVTKQTAYRNYKHFIESVEKESKSPYDSCVSLLKDLEDFWCFYADTHFELYNFGAKILVPIIFAARKGLLNAGYRNQKLDDAILQIVFSIERGFARGWLAEVPKSKYFKGKSQLIKKLLSLKSPKSGEQAIKSYFAGVVSLTESDDLMMEKICIRQFKITKTKKPLVLMLRRVNQLLRNGSGIKPQLNLPDYGVTPNLDLAHTFSKNITDRQLMSLGFKNRNQVDRNNYEKLCNSLGNLILKIGTNLPGKIPVNSPWVSSTKVTKSFLDKRNIKLARLVLRVWHA
jgi:Protein of unknown function DUF262